MIINQSGTAEAVLGGFLACISARISGLRGSIDGSICFASNFLAGADVGATLGAISLTGAAAVDLTTLTGEGILTVGVWIMGFTPKLAEDVTADAVEGGLCWKNLNVQYNV